jgi:hypothetical protein
MAAEIIKLDEIRRPRKPRKSKAKSALKPKKFGKGNKNLTQKPPSPIINSHGPLSEPTTAAQAWRGKPLFMPLKRPCWRDGGTRRVEARHSQFASPVDHHGSKAAIHRLMPRHPTLRIFQRYRW